MDGRPAGKSDEREIFLAKLLVGKDIVMECTVAAKAAECRALRVRP